MFQKQMPCSKIYCRWSPLFRSYVPYTVGGLDKPYRHVERADHGSSSGRDQIRLSHVSLLDRQERLNKSLGHKTVQQLLILV